MEQLSEKTKITYKLSVLREIFYRIIFSKEDSKKLIV